MAAKTSKKAAPVKGGKGGGKSDHMMPEHAKKMGKKMPMKKGM